MGVRIILGALVGGALMFAGGFVEHTIFGWVGRTIQRPIAEASVNADFRKHFPKDGAYSLPPLPADMKNMSEAERTAFNDAYKQGPSGLIVVAPTGQDWMDMKVLGFEFGSNVLCALIASIIVAVLRPDAGFAGRWSVVFLIGVTTWLAVNVSYYLFWRFPWAWVQDELFCTMVEWAAAGIAIAVIVRPKASEVR